MSDPVAELRELLAKATPAPWEVEDRGSSIVIDGSEESLRVAEIDTSYDVPFDREQCEADAALIVAARNRLEALLDIAEAAKDYRCVLLGERSTRGGPGTVRRYEAAERLDAALAGLVSVREETEA